MLKKIIAVCSLMGIQFCYGQADIHFSQFYETSVNRNPALTGVFADDYKVSAFYRSQWASVSIPYTTYMFSGETKVAVAPYSEDLISFGLLAYRDKAGTAGQQITSAYPVVSYNKSLNADYNSYLSLGIAGSYSQYSFDPGKVTFNSQYDNGVINTALPSFENIATNKTSFWNLAAGINFNTSNNQDNTVVYCFGLSGYNLTAQPLSYVRGGKSSINLRGNVNAAVAISMREDIKIQFHGNYAQQGNFNEIMGAFLWTWSPINSFYESEFSLSLGGIYRYNDALAPVVKLRYQKVALSASYDVNISSFTPATNSNGGFELSLSISGAYKDQTSGDRKTVCPRF